MGEDQEESEITSIDAGGSIPPSFPPISAHLPEPRRIQPSLLSSLPPPPRYLVSVRDLSIAAPPPAVTIPLAIPIPVPKFFLRLGRRKREEGEASLAKVLVRDVSLDVHPGEVLAIVGGSGSGKTTLLNAIACRLGNLEVLSGSVEFIPVLGKKNREATPLEHSSGAEEKKGKGQKRELGLASKKGVKKLIGYVRQDDFLLPYLTVRETLSFAASLRLSSSVSPEEKAAIVDQTILELGLKDVEDVLVGGGAVGSGGRKGISGGEKRRLSIGCILVTLPSVLILDEPTTGLDSFTAQQLLFTLSRLAKRGRSVIISIHQPRSDAFPLFDKITLLSTGSVIYSGPTSSLLPYFATHGYSPEPHTNPLEFVVYTSSVDTRDSEKEEVSKERVGKLVRAWRETMLMRSEKGGGGSGGGVDGREALERNQLDVEKGIERITSRGSSHGLEDRRGLDKRASFIGQTILLTRRSMKNVVRNYGQMFGFLVQSLLIGIALGLAFYRPPETPGGIQTLKTIVYQSTPACFYLSIVVGCFIHTKELLIFDREREDNLYSTVPYMLGSFIAYLPANTVFPSLYAIIVYFMCGFRRDRLAVNLFSFIAQCQMQQLAAWSYALLAASLSRSFAQASLLANGFSIPFILSSGYLIINLPVWISWTRWISPYFYGFRWISQLQFEGREFACAGATGPARNACSGDAVLVGLRYHLSSPLWIYPVGLLGFIIVTQALSAILLEVYHPGGVKHAAQISPNATSDQVRAEKGVPDTLDRGGRVSAEVAVRQLGLTVSRRSLTHERIEKSILTAVDALFESGKVSVIMGPSGSGKTSLLQLLAGRLAAGPTSEFSSSGDISVNGRRLDSSLASLVAFVEQEDKQHLPALTVRETLHYAAELRLRDMSKRDKAARAEEVIRMLGLRPCADNLVGGELVKGISGGEKRRLSLAVELISDPAILLADEPLSGLDAFTARAVMEELKDLAASGRTVIVSVHQPSSDIWNLFDNVLLLAKGGRTAFSGPRDEILEFFDSAGEACPLNFNPADFLLDVISVDHQSSEAEVASESRVNQVLDLWAANAVIKKPNIGKEETRKQQPGSFKLRTAPFLTAFPVVLGRSFKNLRRSQDAFAARIANPPFVALLFWIFFARLTRGPSGAQDRVGLLQETTAIPFTGMLSCIAIFPTERALFLYEWRTSGRHSVSTFILAYTAQEIGVSVVSSFLFTVIFMFGMDMQYSVVKCFEFWFTIFALLSFGESAGIIFSSFFSSGGIAVSLVSAGITIMAQLNGIISVTLPHWLEIVGWISPMKPQARIELVNEFHGLTFDCSADQISSGACIAATGDQLLETFGIGPGENGKYMGILLALIVLYRMLAILALRTKVAFS